MSRKKKIGFDPSIEPDCVTNCPEDCEYCSLGMRYREFY